MPSALAICLGCFLTSALAATMTEKDRQDLVKVARGGLCARCSYAKLVRAKNSHFVMCRHPLLPKYQGQPVLSCRYVALIQTPEHE
jgi:hypothetical protein